MLQQVTNKLNPGYQSCTCSPPDITSFVLILLCVLQPVLKMGKEIALDSRKIIIKKKTIVGILHFIESTMDRWVYLKVLKSNLRESVTELGIGNNFIFQQDNDPKHIHECNRIAALQHYKQTIFEGAAAGGMDSNRSRND